MENNEYGVLDGTPEEQAAAYQVVKNIQEQLGPDGEEREKVYTVRRDFYEGRHHLYSNVVGLRSKERQGHILAVFNYVQRFCFRIQQSMTNSPMRFKIVPEDEASEVESIRAEMEENWIRRIFRDNNFNEIILPRSIAIQIRDADFAMKVTVQENMKGEKEIKIQHAENMEKLYVVWDDAAGIEYSGVLYRDKWTLDKIAREFNGYKAMPIQQDSAGTSGESSHSDQYGVFAGSSASSRKSPTGKMDKLPKAWVNDYWGWFRVIDEATGEKVWKMCNIVCINDDVVQFVKSDYELNPWVIGHSFDNPGSPWSMGFIDNLIDPQVELNDRQSDEGDMIRIGSNLKYVVTNMPNFDASSVKPGSGQVIFIEGEQADFRQLQTNINPFPSDSYLNRTMDHLFNLGLPKIAIAAGSAPLTGRIGVIQYQSVSDLVDMLRVKLIPVMEGVIKRIQNYSIQFFPETQGFMTAFDGDSMQDIGITKRDVEFDWDSVLPQSRSEGIVDASNLYDRGAISLKTYLEMSGFRDPMRKIKELKKENEDQDLVTIRKQFQQYARGAVQAQIEAQSALAEEALAEQNAQASAIQQEAQPQQQAPSTMKQNYQNGEDKQPSSSAGVAGVGATTSQSGNVKQVSQQLRAKE